MGGGVKFTNMKVSTDSTNARSRARELAKRLQSGSPTARKEIVSDLGFFEDLAKWAFADELARYFGFRPRETEDEGTYDNGGTARARGTWVIALQTGVKAERGGTTYTFAATAYQETSNSVSVEVFTQSSVAVEAGAGVEGKLGPVKFNLGVKGKVEHGRKSSDKDETKKAQRTSNSASRTFVAERVSHEVLVVVWDKVYHGVSKPTGYGMPGSQIAKRVDYEHRGISIETEYGFQLVQKEGGTPWGPFWPDYTPDGAVIKHSEQPHVREELKRQQRVLAEDLASGFAP